MQIDNYLRLLQEHITELTLGDMISAHQFLDREICRQLAIAPISDTMDLRSAHIRKEVYSFAEQTNDNI